MWIRLLLTLALLTGSVLWAADAYTPLDVKTGQWETTMTIEMSGAPPIPAQLLERLTPEQRAKVEAAAKARSSQGPRTNTHKSCLRKEDLEKGFGFNNDEQKACKPTLVSSSRTKQEVRIDCSQTQMKATGTIHVEALSSESVKITSQMTGTDGARTMNIASTGTSKWLGPTCTESK